eukprot:TRINITY_DN23427_c0_g2_i1.p1 TRINITY_DN23427_c0_g2~~TRINITY_DN23427_c0_g2_i1.p1  ORF type:complete len:235 (+),score=31.50 TRINITY_DN23427_c0_g2_i1:95-799(+)
MSAFTAGQLHTLQLTISTLASLSIVASLLSLYIHCFSSLRKPTVAAFLTLNIAWADLVLSAGYAFGAPLEGSLACFTQAMLIQFFEISAILWTGMIALTLHITFAYFQFDTDKLLSRYRSWVWGTSAVLTMLPVWTDSYGQSHAWCWIRADSFRCWGTFWRFSTFYLMLLLVMIHSSYVAAKFLIRRPAFLPRSHGSPPLASGDDTFILRRCQVSDQKASFSSTFSWISSSCCC